MAQSDLGPYCLQYRCQLHKQIREQKTIGGKGVNNYVLLLECPGGPETPCNGVGHCVDGSKGSGLCVCDKHFTGIACDKCIHGWTGPNCDIGKYIPITI